MDNFKNYTDQIDHFLKGDLSSEKEMELLKRIKSGENEKLLFLEEQKKLQKQLYHSKDELVNNEWNRLKKRINSGHSNHSTQRSFLNFQIPFKTVSAIAAAFLLGIIITTAIYFSFPGQTSIADQIQEISVPFGGKAKFQLPDGSVLWLNSGSKLYYPSVFKDERNIRLEGEGYFDVVKSKQRFVVSTAYGNVAVLGTSFNVKAYSDEDFQTTLVRGSVQVEVNSTDKVVIKPGEQAFLSDEKQLKIAKVEPEIFTAWKEGKLIFKRESFEKVAKRMERWYNVRIEIDNDEIKDLWFTGTIEMETLSEVMELISKSIPIQYSYNKTTRTLQIGKK